MKIRNLKVHCVALVCLLGACGCGPATPKLAKLPPPAEDKEWRNFSAPDAALTMLLPATAMVEMVDEKMTSNNPMRSIGYDIGTALAGGDRTGSRTFAVRSKGLIAGMVPESGLATESSAVLAVQSVLLDSGKFEEGKKEILAQYEQILGSGPKAHAVVDVAVGKADQYEFEGKLKDRETIATLYILRDHTDVVYTVFFLSSKSAPIDTMEFMANFRAEAK